MDGFVDHYAVLGLASEEEGAKLSEKEITKAFRLKAREVHPDKRRDDPNANENFRNLQASYELLKDEQKRKLFDASLSTRRRKRKEEEDFFNDSKRRKMESDLDVREQFAAADREFQKYEHERSAREKAEKFKRDEDERRAREKAKKFKRDEDERSGRKYTEELDAMRAKFGYDHPMKNVKSPSYRRSGRSDNTTGEPCWKQTVLKVSWESVSRGYDAQKLRMYFSSFGLVKNVVVPDKNKNFAYVVMDSRTAVVAVSRMMWLGGRSNPLSAEPLCPVGGSR